MNDRPRRKIALAKHLRKIMTEPERLLWSRLKSREHGVVFKRQQAIGPYILDFFCYKAQLAIEVDGALHGANKAIAHDLARDQYFANLKIETYRVTAAEVYCNADAVADGIWLRAETILKEKQEAPPPPR